MTKLNIMEKKALFGLIGLSILFCAIFFVIGKRNLWFEAKNYYTTHIKDADGLREGSIVTLSGLRVGEVTKLEVDPDNKIAVTFSVKRSLKEKVRANSTARLYRAFVIGEKRIDLTPGDLKLEIIKNKGTVKGVESSELADMISGKNVSKLLNEMSSISGSLDRWKDALLAVSKKVNPEEMTKTYLLIRPTLENINNISKELTAFTDSVKILKKDLIDPKVLQNTIKNTNKLIYPVAKRGALIEQLLDNINAISNELANTPSFASDVISALNETTITLKAIQKTWMLKSHVKDLKD